MTTEPISATEVSPVRALLLMGGEPGVSFHDEAFHYGEFAWILAGEGGLDVRITRDLDVLNQASLEEFDVVINSTSFVEPEAAHAEALVEAVRGGTGFVAVHSGSSTFWNRGEYLTMLGCRFTGHDRYGRFTIALDDSPHPITDGVDMEFETDDELYELGGNVAEFEEFAAAFREERHEAEPQRSLGSGPLGSDITVLAWGGAARGLDPVAPRATERYPLLYTRPFGEGRVHYNALGHDLATLRHPSYRRLLVQGVKWAAGRDNASGE
jgi:type 1 glutamine amidotransferase